MTSEAPWVHHEKQSDRDAERFIAESYGDAMGFTMYKNPDYLRIDFSACVKVVGEQFPTVVQWVEVRRRHNKFSAYPTVMLGLAKWKFGMELFNMTRHPFIFLVKFDDCTKFIDVGEAPRHVKVAYKNKTITDRNDENDLEPVVMLPTGFFVDIQEAAF